MTLSSVSWAGNGPDTDSWISSWHSTPKRSWASSHFTIRQTPGAVCRDCPRRTGSLDKCLEGTPGGVQALSGSDR